MGVALPDDYACTRVKRLILPSLRRAAAAISSSTHWMFSSSGVLEKGFLLHASTFPLFTRHFVPLGQLNYAERRIAIGAFCFKQHARRALEAARPSR
jgi:hypothetical protein